ncbi:hypothetical protein J3R82DRAFT_6941, partial [Butyriboletus roseoflavus]
MDHLPHDQTSPFQARALHFLKKLALRARGSGGTSRDTIPPVAIPTQNFQHAHSSVDLLRKPDISRLIGFRAEDGPNPMDTDDSSQDASMSAKSLRMRHRRHSTLDSLRTPPIHASCAGHGAASASFRDQAGLGNTFLVDDPVHLLAPAPLFLRSTHDAVVQPPRFTMSDPEIPPQISASVSSESKYDEEAVRHTPNDDTPRLWGDVVSHDATLTTPMTDLAPPTSSYPGTLLEAQSVPAPQDFTSQTVQERPPLLFRHSAPLPPPFRVTTERGLRLSPSIVARQPMPLLNLPPLPPPPPPPPATDPLSRQNVPLRSIPLLSRHGRSSVECQADHENATLGDSDEDDGDEGDEEEEPTDALSVHQSDDEDDEPSSAGPSGVHDFKSSQEQRTMNGGSLVEIPASPTLPQSHSVGPNLADYFCSKTYVNSIHLVPSSTSLAMYPFSPNMPSTDDANHRHALDPDLPIPGTRLQSKPSLYHAASWSMTNLGSTRRAERGLRPFKSRETVGSNAGSASGHTTETTAESEISIPLRILRRILRSIHVQRTVALRHMRMKSESWLPPYSNSLYLMAIMPRKMEFSAPGMQAKDRKWRRVVCELEGTTFRVYKCPPGASGGGVLGDWWEKRVGVGDVASPHTPRTRKKEEQFERHAKLDIDGPTPVTTLSILRAIDPPQPRSVSRLGFLPVATGRAQWRNGEVPKPHKSDLLRAYTLQHAESGLGNDYMKRKNVIRVRLEGEQFLLQAPDVPSVVEWIEGLHAGTNIALDIDQRPMPRGPMFPRRRRRRTRRVEAEDATGQRPRGSQRPG